MGDLRSDIMSARGGVDCKEEELLGLEYQVKLLLICLVNFGS